MVFKELKKEEEEKISSSHHNISVKRRKTLTNTKMLFLSGGWAVN
jgi:hypothetical protein